MTPLSSSVRPGGRSERPASATTPGATPTGTRLLVDGVLPCALAALLAIGLLTVQQWRAQSAAFDLHALLAVQRVAGVVATLPENQWPGLLEATRQGRYGMPMTLLELRRPGRTVLRTADATVAATPVRTLTLPLDAPALHGASLRAFVDATPLRTQHRRTVGLGAALIAAVIVLATLSLWALRLRLSPLRQASSGAAAPNTTRTAVADGAAGAPPYGQRQDGRTGDAPLLLSTLGDRFRQPLQALHLFIARLLDGAAGEERHTLLQMRGCVQAMSRLLDAITELAHPGPGPQADDDRQAFSASALFAQVEEQWRFEAERRGARLAWHAGRHWLACDRELAGQVLSELVGNAITHAPAARILVAARRRGPDVRIEVRDNGPGVSAPHRQRLLDGSARPSGAGSGHGLGLPFAIRLARRLGTHIELRSAPGRGSTFAFTLAAGPSGLSREAGRPSGQPPVGNVAPSPSVPRPDRGPDSMPSPKQEFQWTRIVTKPLIVTG